MKSPSVLLSNEIIRFLHFCFYAISFRNKMWVLNLVFSSLPFNILNYKQAKTASNANAVPYFLLSIQSKKYNIEKIWNSLDQADFIIRLNQPTKISYKNESDCMLEDYTVYFTIWITAYVRVTAEAKFLILFQEKTLVLSWLTTNLIKLHSLVLGLRRGDNDLLSG